ncbi:MAG: hypothetical protein EHM23_03080 [Acidobacteria bacterium]|nr:MAG: hypothetical protein EHM23_03080 [Acidobacteriota bacterium]
MLPSDLRAELPYLLLATIVLAAGMATTAFSVVKLKDKALLYFGLFASLYGVRLLIINGIFRSALDIQPSVSQWCAALITYTILVPGALMVRILIGPGWRNLATWVLRTAVAFAPCAIAWAVVTGEPGQPTV